MIKTAPHSTLPPQMWCAKKNKRLVCTHLDLLARICKLVELKEFGLISFPRICFPRLIYCKQEPLLLLNVTEDYFLGVHTMLYQLDTRFVSLQNHLAFPSKSHECALICGIQNYCLNLVINLSMGASLLAVAKSICYRRSVS